MLIYVRLTQKQYLVHQIIQVFCIVLLPYLAIRLCYRYKTFSIFSPIVLCFGAGIVIRNLELISVSQAISGVFRDASILYALPLLLFSSDVKAWLTHSKRTIFSFCLAIISGAFAVIISSIIFQNSITDIWIPAGMIGGIHTGGTPNLFAVGLALGARDEVFTLANSAQIMWGAINLLFVLSCAQSIYGKVLRSFDHPPVPATESSNSYLKYDSMSIRDILISLIIVSIIVAFSIELSYYIFHRLEATLIIVLVTTLSLMCSFSHDIRTLKGPFEIGDYCLLMFGVAVGMMSDFRELIESGGPYIFFIGSIFFLTLFFQLSLSKLFKIDTDTFIITSTAAIYGPVFIPQVARVLKNKSIIVGGIAVSLIGLAVGNYVGIGLAYLVRFLL